MLASMPKHQGTGKLKADLRRRLAQFKGMSPPAWTPAVESLYICWSGKGGST
jgi:hypothetical protein